MVELAAVVVGAVAKRCERVVSLWELRVLILLVCLTEDKFELNSEKRFLEIGVPRIIPLFFVLEFFLGVVREFEKKSSIFEVLSLLKIFSFFLADLELDNFDFDKDFRFLFF